MRLTPRTKWIAAGVILSLPLIVLAILQPPRAARGKAGSLPLADGLDPEQQLAQDLALSDPRVQGYTVGRRSEVFGVRTVGVHHTPASRACATADCHQVEIYNFDENAAVVAVVNVETRQVLDVLYQPGVHPGINQRLFNRAVNLIINDPDVIAALGRRPAPDEAMPMEAGFPGSPCDQGHICFASAYDLGDTMLWAVADLTSEKMAGLARTPIVPNVPGGSATFVPDPGCPAPDTVNQDGWSVSYQTTGTDGFRVFDVAYNGVPVLTSAKLVEWHVDYGATGFVDYTGCGGGGGGFPISPYGETKVLTLTAGAEPVGFELVQDFRMTNWGFNCNYRYEQHFQFMADGRFRAVSGAYGRGCGTNALYRPVVRLDIAVAGDGGDAFAVWDGSQWQAQAAEGWWQQGLPYTLQGFKWRAADQTGQGYYLEPGQGQFGDGGRGDDAFIYAVRHYPPEGDADIGSIGTCCNDDYQQGPHLFLNDESIANQNIVLWYVSQMLTDAALPDYYCWTVQGEPNPITFPCFGGPMFVPMTHAGFSHNGPVVVGSAAVFTNTSTGLAPLSHYWDFGDGVGASTDLHPTYVYTAAGTYNVTLTVSSSVESETASQVVQVGLAAVAGFSHTFPARAGEVVTFTNTSTGTAPVSYTWDFGDGAALSTAASPTHVYTAPGAYTVTLTAANPFGSSAAVRVVEVPYSMYLPLTWR